MNKGTTVISEFLLIRQKDNNTITENKPDVYRYKN